MSESYARIRRTGKSVRQELIRSQEISSCALFFEYNVLSNASSNSQKNPNEDTPLCSVNIPGRRSKVIRKENTRVFMKVICETFRGQSKFGFSPNEIGNRSVRSGAAMSLFLTDHSPDKIMLLGRWKSRAFLVYIRPQVTEWCDLFSIDMISFNNYFELFASTSQQKSKLKGNERQRKDYYMPQYMCE